MEKPKFNYNVRAYSGKCRREGCNVVFMGHGNRRFWSRICKEKYAYHKKLNSNNSKVLSQLPSPSYHSCAVILREIYDSHEVKPVWMSLSKLIETGFNLFSRHTPVEREILGCDLRRYHNLILLIHKKGQKCCLMTEEDLESFDITRHF
jgi:hypothetical protein